MTTPRDFVRITSSKEYEEYCTWRKEMEYRSIRSDSSATPHMYCCDNYSPTNGSSAEEYDKSLYHDITFSEFKTKYMKPKLTPSEMYKQLQAKWVELVGLKDGDTVKVTREWSPNEGGYTGSYWKSSDKYVGKEYAVASLSACLDESLGINCSEGPIVPYFCLEKVEPKKEEVFYKLGDKFTDGKNKYILAKQYLSPSSLYYVSLIMIEGYNMGNIYHAPEAVSSFSKITESEFSRIRGGLGLTKI